MDHDVVTGGSFRGSHAEIRRRILNSKSGCASVQDGPGVPSNPAQATPLVVRTRASLGLFPEASLR
jgi:hypothetical protein